MKNQKQKEKSPVKINPDEIPEQGWKYYVLDGQEYAVYKENDQLRFFKLKPLSPPVLPAQELS